MNDYLLNLWTALINEIGLEGTEKAREVIAAITATYNNQELAEICQDIAYTWSQTNSNLFCIAKIVEIPPARKGDEQAVRFEYLSGASVKQHKEYIRAFLACGTYNRRHQYNEVTAIAKPLEVRIPKGVEVPTIESQIEYLLQRSAWSEGVTLAELLNSEYGYIKNCLFSSFRHNFTRYEFRILGLVPSAWKNHFKAVSQRLQADAKELFKATYSKREVDTAIAVLQAKYC